MSNNNKNEINKVRVRKAIAFSTKNPPISLVYIFGQKKNKI